VSAQNNQISNLSSLVNLENLSMLYLDDNQIRDVTPLSVMTNMSGWLSLRNNQINDLSPLLSLTNLSTLSVTDGNPINEEQLEYWREREFELIHRELELRPPHQNS
jgi:internalin A